MISYIILALGCLIFGIIIGFTIAMCTQIKNIHKTNYYEFSDKLKEPKPKGDIDVISSRKSVEHSITYENYKN